MKPINPFLISGYYSPEYFCARNSETFEIIDALKSGRNVTLIAPRRMGKTGLIHHVFHKIKEQEQDAITLYMDIYSTQSLSDFVRLLASTVLGKLDSTVQKAMNRIGKYLHSSRPILSFNKITGMPRVNIELGTNTEESTLKEIFEYLGSSEKQCYIAIDEFQQIAQYPEKSIEALLAAYIQFLPNVQFIFAGSKQDVLHNIFTTPKRPFYLGAQILTINAIDRDEYAQFAIDHFAKHGKRISKEIFYDIYDRYDGHTWYVQNILNRLYAYNLDVYSVLVKDATEQIISEYSYLYADMLKNYPTGCVRLLRAIAQEECVKEALAGDFISKYKLRAASSVASALKKLISNELVHRSEAGYTVYDRFLDEWLRRLGQAM